MHNFPTKTGGGGALFPNYEGATKIKDFFFFPMTETEGNGGTQSQANLGFNSSWRNTGKTMRGVGGV